MNCMSYNLKKVSSVTLQLRGTECVVDSWTDGVAVRVPAKDDGSLLHKKVKELRSRVDSDLGFVDDLNGEETQDPYVSGFSGNF